LFSFTNQVIQGLQSLRS